MNPRAGIGKKMRYRQLGRTGLKVSELCLGTMTFGEQNSEAEGHAQMDCAVDCGINMFDAAEIYPVPPKREIVSIQNAYNLVNRTFEIGLSEVAQRENVSLLGYSPLGQGYLTGKYEGGALPPGSRKTLFNRLGRYEKGNGPKAISAYVALARKHGLDPAQMAIAFAVSRPFVTSTIIGATALEQLKTDIAATELKISDNLLEDINQIHLDYSNPCP